MKNKIPDLQKAIEDLTALTKSVKDRPKQADQPETIRRPPALKHGAFSTLTILPGEDWNEFVALYKSIAAELMPDGPIETYAVKTIAQSIWRASHLGIFQRIKLARAKYGEADQDEDQPPPDHPKKAEYDRLISEATHFYRAGHVFLDTQDFIMQEVAGQVASAIATLSRELNIEDVPEAEFLKIAVIDYLSDDEKKILTNMAKGTKMKLNELLKTAEDNFQLAMIAGDVTEESFEKELVIIERLDARISRAMKVLMQAKAMKEIIGTDPKSRAARAKLDVQTKT